MEGFIINILLTSAIVSAVFILWGGYPRFKEKRKLVKRINEFQTKNGVWVHSDVEGSWAILENHTDISSSIKVNEKYFHSDPFVMMSMYENERSK